MAKTESITIATPEIDFGKITKSCSFEHFLLNLAISFVNLPYERIDEEVDRALEMTGLFTGVDRSYVMEYDFRGQVVNNTHEWCAEGIEPMIDSLQQVPIEGMDEDWVNIHLRGEIVHVPDVASLPEGAPLRRILEPQGIITLVAVPMIYQGNCLGFVGFDAVEKRILWTPEQLVLVRLLAELFTNAQMSLRANQEIQRERSKSVTATRMLLSSVRATGTAVWELDSETSTVRMLAGWYRLLNMSWDGKEISLNEFLDYVHYDDVGTIQKALSQSKVTVDARNSVDFRMRGKDGHWRHLRAWWVAEDALENETRSIVRYYGGTMNISEEIRLAKKHMLLSNISARFVDRDSIHGAIDSAMNDLNSYFDAESVALVFHDFTYETVISPKTTYQNQPPKAAASLWSRIVSANDEHFKELSNGSFVHLHHTATAHTKDGNDMFAGNHCFQSVVFMPISVGRHFIGCLVTTYRDFKFRIAESHTDVMRSCVEILGGAIGRIRAEQTVRESEEIHSLSLNSLEDTVYLADSSGRINFINPAGSKLFGFPIDSFIGRSIGDFIEAESPLPTLHEMTDASPAIIRARTRDGALHVLSIRIIRVSERQEDRQCYFGTIRDITLQQAWEESLITQKIISENQNDTKSMYFSNLSHELRTPIHGVIGILDLMKQSGELGQRNYDLANSAYRSGVILLRLLDDILEIAKLGRGVIRIQPEQINLEATIQSIVMMFEENASNKGLRLEVEISAMIPKSLFLDELRIRQVLSNLLSNAIKYTSDGFVRLTATWRQDAGEMPWLIISVEDSGVGIAANNIPRLFEPFVRVSSYAIQDHESGSGLGLPITKMIVEMMKGEIALDSTPGVGTHIEVKLPIIDQKLYPMTTMDFSGEDIIRKSLAGMAVLIAEDNEINRILAEEHLTSLECDVHSVENGKEAVSLCRERRFDVVLMDIAMPVMDGFEASRQILLGSSNHDRPVVIGCTANASHAAISRCLKCGMLGVVVKPFTRDDLFRALSPYVNPVEKNRIESECLDDDCPILDFAAIHHLKIQLKGAREHLQRIIQGFITSTKNQVSTILSSAAGGDFEECARIVHILRGGASSLGARKLADICAAIEYTFDNRIVLGYEFNERFPRMIDDLEKCAEETIRAFDSFTKEWTNQGPNSI